MEIKSMFRILHSAGYQEIQIEQMQVYGFVKCYESMAKLCFVVDNTMLRFYGEEELKEIKEEVENSLCARLGCSIDAICFVLTKQVERDRGLCQGNVCWLIDVKEQLLLVYENQPDDFDNLRGIMEESLFVDTPREKRKFKPAWITLGLLAINIVIYILVEIFGSSYDPQFLMSVGASSWKKEFLDHEFYRWFTCMFLHFGIGHLVNNMIVLYLVGSQAEVIYGRVRYLILYFATGLCSSIVSSTYYMAISDGNISAGASGAIFGIIGALAVAFFFQRERIGRLFPRIMILIAVSISSGLMDATVDNAAHIGGLIAGIILGGTMILFRKSKVS